MNFTIYFNIFYYYIITYKSHNNWIIPLFLQKKK